MLLTSAPASAVGVGFTFMGRTSALPTILNHYKGTKKIRFCNTNRQVFLPKWTNRTQEAWFVTTTLLVLALTKH